MAHLTAPGGKNTGAGVGKNGGDVCKKQLGYTAVSEVHVHVPLHVCGNHSADHAEWHKMLFLSFVFF